MDASLAFTSAVEMRRLIGSKEVSVPELVEFFYQRIEQLDPRLNAYLALCPDQALARPIPPRKRYSEAIPWVRSTAYRCPSKTWR